MKKIMSFFLTVCIILSVFSAVSVSAANNITITMGNKEYQYKKNSLINYKCKIVADDFVSCGQYVIDYPSSVLKILSVDFPVINDSTIYNYTDVEDKLFFNFTKASSNKKNLYDFTSSSKNNVLINITFKAIDTGSGKIKLTEEVLADIKLDDVKAKYSETLTKSNYKSPTLSDTKKTLYVKKKFNLKVKNGSDSSVKWKSLNTKIATVTQKGKVVAKKSGTTTVTAVKDGKTLSCKIIVKNPKVSIIKNKIKAKKSTNIIVKNAVGKVKYKTLTPKILKVNSNGKVTAIKKGNGKIRVIASGIKTIIKIKVK